MNKKIVTIVSIFLLMFIFIGCNENKKEVKTTEEKILSKGEKFTFTENGKEEYWVKIDSAQIENGELKVKYSYGNIDFKNKTVFIWGDDFKVKDNNNSILDSTGSYWRDVKELEPGENCTVETSYHLDDTSINSITISLSSKTLKQTAVWKLNLK
ncbi:hypothetical protein [Clostridium perfringens]|uniref:Lipoprotein n=1 Tax=Clostridium perfringens TaxID=1502 RepID=A0ABD4PN71_CLOPF|nr:hypothetical protein [Clostridium perfringens]MBO3415831.1 hypothetical protein [Clostridium perfringens]